MRNALAASTLTVAVMLGASTASATPAMPRPLERIIDDADLVVVAKLRTKPAHPGDEFEVDVEETLKGSAGAGRVRAKASYFFTGCVLKPEGTPAPASIEGRCERAVLFLDAEKDGARQSRDPIVLDAETTVSAWFYDQRPAKLAVGSIKTLVALDAEPDAARGGVLWERGLAGDDPLLVTCLLHRIGFSAGNGDDDWHIGKRLVGVARAQFAAARARLLPHLARLAASDDQVHRRIALRSAQACLPSTDAAERPAIDAILAAARKASRDADVGVRGDALRCLATARDPDVPDRLLAAVRKRPLDRDVLADIGEVGRALLFAAYPDRERDFIAAAVAMLDEKGCEPTGLELLESLTGECVGDADAWRAWWKKRTAPK